MRLKHIYFIIYWSFSMHILIIQFLASFPVGILVFLLELEQDLNVNFLIDKSRF
jgi:hypothetical protein